MWTEKYRPKKVSQMIGNEEARAELYRWLANWKPGMKPIFLIGPPGVGKTTAVHAAANELGYLVLELNASDFRTKEALERKLRGIGRVTLFGEKTVVFLDEVDGLFSLEDRGGAEYLLNLIDNPEIPYILAANRDDLDFVKKLERKTQVIRFKRVPLREIEVYLRHILNSEGLKVSDELIRAAINSSFGDVRAAINNLQAAISTGSPMYSYRDRDYMLEDVIRNLTLIRRKTELIQMLSNSLSDPDSRLKTIFHSVLASNLPINDVISSLRKISEADVLLGRIKRTQRWRLLRYMDRLLADAIYGLTLIPSEDSTPWNIRKRIWRGDAANLQRLARYLNRRFRISRGDAILFYLDIALLVYKDKLEFLVREANLDEKGRKILKEESDSILEKLRR